MRWLYIGLAVAFVALAGAIAGAGWLVGTEAGLHWAAAQIPALRFEGLRGRLAGEMHADALAYETPGMRIEAEKIRLRAHLAALLGGRLTIDPLHAAAVAIEWRESEEKKNLELPLRIHVANVRIDALEVRRGAARYLVRELDIEHARLGREVSVAASLYWPDERFATRARLRLGGSLERIEAHALADVAGVAVEARAVVVAKSLQPLQGIEARAGAIDLARFHAALPHTGFHAALRGEMSAGGALSGMLSLENTLAGTIDADRLPFTRLDARFLTDFASARLSGMRIALRGGGSVQGEAELQPGNVRARLVAAGVDLRSLHSRLRRTALHGPLQVWVDEERQWARGSLTQEGIGLTADVLRTGSVIDIRELRALVEGGAVSATGRVTLAGPTPVSLKLEVARFNPAAIGDYPAGSLSGSVTVAGRLSPRDVDLKWSFRDSELYRRAFLSAGTARIVGERVAAADGDVHLGANRLNVRGAYGRPGDQLALALDAPRLEEFTSVAGSLRARATLSGSLDNPRAALSAEARMLKFGAVELASASAKLSGTRTAHDIELAASAPELTLELDSRLRGGWSGARGWVGEIRTLRNAGAYPLELVAPAPLRLTHRAVELGRLEARAAGGRVLVREAAWSPAQVASSGEFNRLPAQWLIVAAQLDQKLDASLRLDGEWELARKKHMEGVIRVRRADGDVAVKGERPVDLGLESAALEARFSGGRAAGELEASSRLARLRLAGELVPALALQGRMEFAELGVLTRPLLQEVRLDGRAFAELRATGTLARPLLHGTLNGEALALEYPAYGVILKEGKLIALLDGEQLRLESLTAQGREGSLSAKGTVPLALAGARLAWRADKLTLLHRPDMRLVASGEGEASYDGKRVTLTGDLRAERGHFEIARERLPRLGEDVVVLGDPELRRAEGRPKLPLTLDVRLDLGGNLVVQGYGYDGKVAGLVDLATTSDGELRAFGRIHAVNATFLAYGQRLQVDPGVLIFDGPLDNPALQITAWRRNQPVEAGVQLTGTARAPIVNLVSQPPVPEGERLSWLVLGRPPSNATQADLGLLQAAAGALLAGGDSVPLDRRIARRFGLDEVSLRGGSEVADRVVAFGKRLSDRLYISYEQGLGAVATNLVKLDYALGRRWTLRAETGSASGGGLFYRYAWD